MTSRKEPYDTAMSTPCIGEAGNTGDWRSKRPVTDESKCLSAKSGTIKCQICWVYCPEGVISRAVSPQVDLAFCKGCGICAEVCPAGAIEMVPEGVHAVCAADEEPGE
jgi:pyruvate ferredoxin oxidoreductase delta subunit